MSVNTKKPTDPVFDNSTYNPTQAVLNADTARQNAAKALAQYEKNGFTWDQSELYKTLQSNYLNRPDFSYDFNADALYQQYKDKYIQQGKMAMQDTMGQASAMTGGYGNSYAATVGNQAYQASLQNLNDVIPELYQMAYDRYNQKGQDMLNQLGLLESDYSMKYGEYKDGYDKLVADRAYYDSAYESEYSRDYDSWLEAITRKNNITQKTYENETSAYNTATTNARDDVYKAVSSGIMPSDAMIEAAGLDKATIQAMAKVYSDESEAKKDTQKSYSGTTKTGKNYNNGTLTNAQVKELQAKLGVESDGYYGSISKNAAGGLSAVEAYKKYVEEGYDPNKEGNDQPFQPKNTDGVKTFKASIRTKAEYMRSAEEKKRYKTYNAYIEGTIDKWLAEGKLDDDEAATLLTYYNL